MFCAIQWDQIPIVTVPFKPLWNQDGSRNVWLSYLPSCQRQKWQFL
jgi:hypothetical protein